MPTIYQARCDRCDYASEVFPGFYGAVFVDTPIANRSEHLVAAMVRWESPSTAQVATQPDPRFVVLAHPAENRILTSTGYTWTDLATEGRYVGIKRVACQACGTLFDVRRLQCPPAFGCQTAFVGGIVFGVAAGLWRRSVWFGFAMAYSAVFAWVILAGLAAKAYVRIRFRKRALELDGPRNCPQCKSTKYINPPTHRVFPCPKCAEQSMRVKIVGNS